MLPKIKRLRETSREKYRIFASLFPAISSGDSFPLDGFGYTVGDQSLAGINALVDGFEGEWLGAILGGNSPGIVLNSLDYPGTTSHGGAVQFTGGGNARVGRLFEEGGLDNSAEGIAYFSIRMQAQLSSPQRSQSLTLELMER